MIIVLISTDLRAILTKTISGIKYHCVVRFPIGYVYNKGKKKQLLLNSLKYTSLGSLLHFKTDTVSDRHQAINFSKRKCMFETPFFGVYNFFFLTCIFLSLKHQHKNIIQLLTNEALDMM